MTKERRTRYLRSAYVSEDRVVIQCESPERAEAAHAKVMEWLHELHEADVGRAKLAVLEPKANGELCSFHGERREEGCKGCKAAGETAGRLDAIAPEGS